MLIGDQSSGKRELLITYTTGICPVESEYVGNKLVYDTPINLELWDTENLEEFDSLRSLIYSEIDVFLVYFSVASPSSFNKLAKRWIADVKLHYPGVPFLLVGTRVELRRAIVRPHCKCRIPISYKDGEKLAAKLKAVAYVECSASTKQRLNDVASRDDAQVDKQCLEMFEFVL
jgi:GTPase SAR1 family protein